jgi:hypothetical protein
MIICLSFVTRHIASIRIGIVPVSLDGYDMFTWNSVISYMPNRYAYLLI